MFGNALGWVVSAVLGAFAGALIFYGGRIDPPTPPTKDSDITLGLHSAALPVSPADLVTPGKEDADASESYRAAADDFRSNQYKYDQANQSPKFKSEAESKKDDDGLRQRARAGRVQAHRAGPRLRERVDLRRSAPDGDQLR